jgi:RNA polymerase sigma-70 factor (ECF subfamily)
MKATRDTALVDAASDSVKTGSVAAGAPLDLNQLFTQHRHHLRRFVQRYVRNPEDAEDVVQNTFYEALRCADRFSGLSKPSTWLFGIALNLARNQVRRNCAVSLECLDEILMDTLIDANSDPCTIVETRQMAARVEALLDSLPADVRATVDQVLDGEHTYEEAAKHLQIPVGTVRSRVSRVRASMRTTCR